MPKSQGAAASSKSATKKPKPKPTLPASIVGALPTSAAFMQHLNAAAALIPVIDKEMARAKKGGAVPLARAYVALHRMIERTDELLKPGWDLFNRCKAVDLPQTFEQDGVTNIPLNEGFRVGLSNKFVASIKPGEKDKAYDWLRSIGLGDLIQGTVNAGTLSAAAKQLLEDKNIELPSELFNTAFIPNVSVVATK